MGQIAYRKSEAPEYKENPFLKDLGRPGVMMIKPKQNAVISKSEGLVDLDTGTIQKDVILMGRRKFVDKSDFIKVYTKNIGFIFDLNRSTQKVFKHILENIMYVNNMAILSPSEVCRMENMVRTTYDRAITRLLYHKVIAKSIYTHTYFVNPVFICKGERFAMYTEYVRRYQGELFEGELFEDQKKDLKTLESKLNQSIKKIEA